MKVISIEMPEKLAIELENYVKAGWFKDESEITLAALRDFVRRNRIELMERFMLEDIEWAKRQEKSI